jgi:hypothetical protein
MTSIDECPLEVDERLVPGHWKGDLNKVERNRSQVGILVKSTTWDLKPPILLIRIHQGTGTTMKNQHLFSYKKTVCVNSYLDIAVADSDFLRIQNAFHNLSRTTL